MSTFTENYNLIKPDAEDYYDIQDANENMDAIDAQMFSLEQETNGISEKIGEVTDSTEETVFGHLNRMEETLSKGSSVIKSIQRVTHTIPTGTTSSSRNINIVDPKKCFVIMERLKNDFEKPYTISYTLNESSLGFTHGNLANASSVILGFWIIEFY